MADIWKVVASWTGGAIGSGFTNFYFHAGTSTAQASQDSARAFLFSSYGAALALLPTGVSINFAGSVDSLDVVTGALTGTVPVTNPGTIAGSGTGAYAAPTGACVTWLTGGLVNGRRLRGRTFLVPMAGNAFHSDGTLADTTISTITSAATAFIAAAPDFAVWHRPAPGGGGGGSATTVAGFRITDKAAVLTSRR